MGTDQPERPVARSSGTGEPASVVRQSGTEEAALPHLRVSDEERHRVAEVLGEHAAAGRLTLAELEERVALAYAATTRADLTELTTDLPALTEPETRKRTISRWVVAVMGGSNWRGRRRLAGRAHVVAIMGGNDLDLREAEIEGDELVINVFSLMGGSSIYLPDSVEVELSGPAIMGGNDERGSVRRARPGAPLIRIRSLAIMGGVEVWRLPAETRGMSLKVARRAAKALERGEH